MVGGSWPALLLWERDSQSLSEKEKTNGLETRALRPLITACRQQCATL